MEQQLSFSFSDPVEVVLPCCKKCNELKTLRYSEKTGKPYYVCIPCEKTRKRAGNKKQKEEILKQRMVDYLGSKCNTCGYSYCNDPLECHHINPLLKNKEMKLRPSYLHSYTWEEITEELDKCICLCSTCHSEIHYHMDECKDKPDEYYWIQNSLEELKKRMTTKAAKIITLKPVKLSWYQKIVQFCTSNLV